MLHGAGVVVEILLETGRTGRRGGFGLGVRFSVRVCRNGRRTVVRHGDWQRLRLPRLRAIPTADACSQRAVQSVDAGVMM